MEYDSNVQATLERPNHVGTQTCDTISDLAECVEAFNFITALKDQLTLLRDRLQQVENELFGAGDLGEILNQLRTSLEARILQAENDINDLQTGVRNLEAVTDSLAANLAALQELVDFYFTNLNNTVNGLRDIFNATAGTINNLQSLLTQLRQDLNGEIAARIAGDANLLTALQQEQVARNTVDTQLQVNITNEANARFAIDATKAPLDSPVFTGTVTINGAMNSALVSNTAHPPANANTNEIVTTNWFNSRLNERFGAIADVDLNPYARLAGNPQFSQGLGTGGDLYMHTGGFTVSPVANDNSNRIPNTNWVVNRLNYLAAQIPATSDLSNYATLSGATFTGGIIVNQSIDILDQLNVRGTAQFHNTVAVFHGGARTAGIPNDANASEVPNANWVNNRINASASGLGGGPSSYIVFSLGVGTPTSLKAGNIISASFTNTTEGYNTTIQLNYTPVRVISLNSNTIFTISGTTVTASTPVNGLVVYFF